MPLECYLLFVAKKMGTEPFFFLGSVIRISFEKQFLRIESDFLMFLRKWEHALLLFLSFWMMKNCFIKQLSNKTRSKIWIKEQGLKWTGSYQVMGFMAITLATIKSVHKKSQESTKILFYLFAGSSCGHSTKDGTKGSLKCIRGCMLLQHFQPLYQQGF